jgi:hypothetical protein
MKSKKLKIFLITVSVLAAVCCHSPKTISDKEYKLDSLTINSLKKLSEYPFYSMIYFSQYPFQEYLNGQREFPQLSLPLDSKIKCTCFAAMGNSDSIFFGRNFDFPNSIPLVLYTDPPDGFASISMTDLQFFGLDRTKLADSSFDKRLLLNTPWLPIDGINENGVSVGIMVVESENPPSEPHKHTINEAAVIRLVLDYATSVEHAIDLINSYNVSTTLFDSTPEHYLISDSNGESVVVEFIDEEVKIISNQYPWQVATNFNIFGVDTSSITCERFIKASQELKKFRGIFDSQQSMDLLKNTSQLNSTKWSVVYNLTSKNILISIAQNYEEIYKFNLEKIGRQKTSKQNNLNNK